MKELSIEEKARRYDEAIEELRGLLEGIHEEKCEIMEEDITNIFPELKESESEDEEERIRNYILFHFQEHLNKIDEFIREGMTAPFSSEEIKMLEASVAWLEKQGEQKPAWSEEEVEIIDWLVASFDCLKIPTDTFYQSKVRPFLISLRNKIQPIRKEWSEEDEKYLKHAIEDFQKLGDSYLTFWVKSLKNRCITLPIQEWNEKDDRLLRVCVAAINGIDNFCPENKQELTDWLKSLRPQPQWKPSDEQMEALKAMMRFCEIATSFDAYKQRVVESLYSDLKKLKG